MLSFLCALPPGHRPYGPEAACSVVNYFYIIRIVEFVYQVHMLACHSLIIDPHSPAVDATMLSG